MELTLFLDYFYAAHYIPIYLYQNGELIFSVPQQEQSTYPLHHYLKLLTENDHKLTYTMTSFFSYYGSVQLEENRYLIIGPINDFPYNDESLLHIKKEFQYKEAEEESFMAFFKNIPTQNWDSFINTLLFLDFVLNQRALTKQDVIQITDENSNINIEADFVVTSAEKREEGALYNSFNVEEAMVRFVEQGKPEKLKELAKQARYSKIGEIAPSALRQWKNVFIVTTTLISRAAMRGGLSPSIAYQLSNVYMQQVERLIDVEAVKSLSWQVQIDYANRVADASIPKHVDQILHEIVQYIRNHTNQSITVGELAEQVGYTSSSLSRKFSKELGVSLSQFIRETKLEDAKDLLMFSNQSISEISNYLCFSSQSHFQKAFKDFVGTTPEKYRKSSKQLNLDN